MACPYCFVDDGEGHTPNCRAIEEAKKRERVVRNMDQYERSIREKVHAAGILTPGEWVYLVGLFQLARESE